MTVSTHLSSWLTPPPYNMRLTGEEQNTLYTPHTQERPGGLNSLNGPSQPIRCHLQLLTKIGVGVGGRVEKSQSAQLIRQNMVNKLVVVRYKLVAFSTDKFQRLLPGRGRGKQMEILLKNVNTSFRSIFSSWFFRTSPVCVCSSSHEVRIILMPRRHRLGWQIFLFRSLCV